MRVREFENSQLLHSNENVAVYLVHTPDEMKAVKFRAVATVEEADLQLLHLRMLRALESPGIVHLEHAEKSVQEKGLTIKLTMKALLSPLDSFLKEQSTFREERVRDLVLQLAKTLAVAERYVRSK